MEALNPTNEIKLTTKSLGIADAKAEDLGGYSLSQKDIANAATKILIAVGIDINDIRTIKVGVDPERKLRIICEVKYKAAFKHKEKENSSWFSFQSQESDDDDNKGAFNKTFYDALYNKVYHGKKKHLKLSIVRRQDNKGDYKKYVRFEFDPYIFLAFVYDIVFTDNLYKVSAPVIPWKSEKSLDDMSGAERKRYKARKREMVSEKLSNCIVLITFRKDAKWTKYKKDENGNTVVDKVYTGFCPAEVDDFYANMA